MSVEELKRESACTDKNWRVEREREGERERERGRESNVFARGVVHVRYRFLFVPCLRLFLLSTHSFTHIVLLVSELTIPYPPFPIVNPIVKVPGA